MKNKNIIPYNNKGNINGYLLHYVNHVDDYLDVRGTWKNNKPIAYLESHYYYIATIFHIR